LAQSQIPPVDITYYKYNSRTVSDTGILTSTYAAGVIIKANVHPVPRSVYQEQGLDFNKKYIKVFTQNQIDDLDRNRSADKIAYKGESFQVFNESDWKTYNGWNSFLAVRID
jgi:hypothetical protein